MAETLSRARQVAYALGNPGFQLTERIVVAVAVYYYLPPGGSDLVDQVPRETFLGVLTAFGVASILGRVLDSVADPFVGFASDRSRSRFGRRRAFLMAGVLPMVGIPVLIFFPPGAPGSTLNTVWLTLLLGLYFVFFTVYVAPYLALLPELAPDQSGRVRLATLLALLAFPVLGIFGFAWTLGLEAGRAAGLSGEQAIRVVVAVASLAALALCLAPIAAVDERRFVRGVHSELPFREAVRRTLVNQPFLVYLAAQLFFILGINLIQPALPYYAVVVFGRSEGFAAWLGAAIGVSIIASFPVMNRVAARTGPKRTMVGCVVLFSLAQCAFGLLRPDVPGGPHDAWNLGLGFTVMAVIGPCIAGFLVLPHVLISQLIDLDEVRSGANRSAMFFGMQGFMTKWMYGVSAALLAFLFGHFGNSQEAPLGVLLVGPIAGIAGLASAVLFAAYPERRVLEETARRRA